MAERRNARILKTPFPLVMMLGLFIVGCRPANTIQPGAVSEQKTITDGPILLAATAQPFTSPVRPQITATRTVPPSTAYPTKNPAPTIFHAAEATETASPVIFATLESDWPTPPIQIPAPLAPYDKPDNVVNILLLGNDVPWAQGGRTDSIIFVSLNRATRKATLLSIPRDLYVVIPGWRMNRINLALPHGHGTDYPGGGGALVKDTILYNLGIPVDFYVRIGFSGFKEIVDSLGGVEIVVNCPIEDWRLRSSELDPEIEENWEPYLLQPGVRHMDGELALWYVRSRHNSNDIDRGRRQQKMIRAILQEAKSADVMAKIPQLWASFADMFETDMSLADILELAVMAPEIGEIEHLLLLGEALRPWTVPGTGEAVQLLNQPAAEPLLRLFMGDTTLHGVNRAPIVVEVETNDPIMYRQVADNLIWFGFEPSLIYRDTPDPLNTTVEYLGSNTKGAFIDRLSFVFRHNVSDIIVHDDQTGPAAYRVTLGKNHNPCLSYLTDVQSE